MCCNTLCLLFLIFFISFLSLLSLSSGYGVHKNNSFRQLDLDSLNETKDGEPSAEILDENVANEKIDEDNNLFWVLSDTNSSEISNFSENNTTEEDLQSLETVTEPITSAMTPSYDVENAPKIPLMDEIIFLERNHCNLEITIQDNNDLRVEIKFDKLQNMSSGKCCITLNGRENVMLAVLISNINLYRNNSEGEVLKVVVAGANGVDFVMRRYDLDTQYQPLLLTETHRVYLILEYKIGNICSKEKETSFNLEVFTYSRNKKGNQPNNQQYYYGNYYV